MREVVSAFLDQWSILLACVGLCLVISPIESIALASGSALAAVLACEVYAQGGE